MNTPNKLTVMRMILTPFFLLALLWEFPFHYWVALGIFIFASLTDMWDGKLARKYNLITDFGKFLDPIADKMLTTAAFLGFIQLDLGVGVVWITFLVLMREFMVASVRMLAAAKGTVIAADIWGKVKTVVQMVAVIMVLSFEGFMELFARFCPSFTLLNAPMVILYNIVLWASAVLTVISGVNYLVKNKECLGLKDL
ncbi:MAG: CDP-diacylglycerol--glycerol-3-phosphate 3-phosphatidyltransferase [Clostridia bacterium]|nr:CDP-diacylglycerol--glycerol-3-phosphate 3-phosphatidyltransferase [Clostridia bacterium]